MYSRTARNDWRALSARLLGQASTPFGEPPTRGRSPACAWTSHCLHVRHPPLQNLGDPPSRQASNGASGSRPEHRWFCGIYKSLAPQTEESA